MALTCCWISVAQCLIHLGWHDQHCCCSYRHRHGWASLDIVDYRGISLANAMAMLLTRQEKGPRLYLAVTASIFQFITRAPHANAYFSCHGPRRVLSVFSSHALGCRLKRAANRHLVCRVCEVVWHGASSPSNFETRQNVAAVPRSIGWGVREVKVEHHGRRRSHVLFNRGMVAQAAVLMNGDDWQSCTGMMRALVSRCSGSCLLLLFWLWLLLLQALLLLWQPLPAVHVILGTRLLLPSARRRKLCLLLWRAMQLPPP